MTLALACDSVLFARTCGLDKRATAVFIARRMIDVGGVHRSSCGVHLN
jgi:hypothetical protein